MSPLEKLIRYNKDVPYEQRKIIPYYTETGKPVVGLVSEELQSFLIGGLPGSGKTSAMAFLICQIIMAQGKILMCDPHWNAPRDALAKAIRPLSEWFALPLPEFDEEDITPALERFRYFYEEYKRRKRSGTVETPLFLICDEWAEMLGMLDDDEYEEVITIVSTVAGGGRKYGMFLALANQVWNLDSTGGHAIRKKVPGRLAFHAEQADMRMLLNTRDSRTLADLCTPALRPGEAILKRASMLRVSYPFTGLMHCQAVATVMHTVFVSESAKNTQKTTVLHQSDTKMHAKGPDKPIGSNGNIRKDDLEIPGNEYQEVVRVGNRLLAETGRVKRSDIQKILGWNRYQYEKIIMPICNHLGWTHDMNKKTLSTQEKQALKQGAICAKCGSSENLEVDHIVPRAKGGGHEQENLQVLCATCNKSKGISD